MEEKEKEIIEETPEEIEEIDETGEEATDQEEKPNRLYTFEKVLGEELDEETYQAVSYTHLTLPTIA